MKKFISVIPMQTPNQLSKAVYDSGSNLSLKTELATSFPILVPMYKDVKPGEKIGVVTVKIKGAPNLAENTEQFQTQLNEIKEAKKFEVVEQIIEIEFTEAIDNQLKLFSAIMDCINENDEIIADITYGSKAMPVITVNALQCVCKTVKNVYVDKLIYGSKDFSGNKSMRIFDVSALYFLNGVLDALAKADVPITPELIKEMLKIEDDNNTDGD
ncbi:MAG: hypothetical protein IJ172_07835 [Ruminococcus sp.]|nr:hypothetical protein [Ruminococcus sp.]